MKNKKKRSVTLIEMMIVMFLIAMIIGVVAFNYKGSLDEGKAFKTKAAIEKIETILNIAEAEGSSDVRGQWREYVKNSPLVQKGTDLTKDAWGQEFELVEEEGQIKMVSKNFNAYVAKNPTSMFR